MKKVISLIGLDRGKERYMHPHEADAAVSTGSACWPEDFVGQETPEEDPFEDLNIRELAGMTVLQGEWPERAVITSRLRNQGNAQVFRTGTAILTFGERKAIYQSLGNVPGSTDLQAVLREVQDPVDEMEDAAEDGSDTPVQQDAHIADEGEASDVDADAAGDGVQGDEIVIPEDWPSLHWKQRTQLASRIKGEEVTGVAEANAIIEDYLQD